MASGRNAYAEIPAVQRVYTEAHQAQHQPLLVAMDVSGSMDFTEQGQTKTNVQLAEEMVNQIGEDPMLKDVYKRTADICIMTFADNVDTVCDWQPLSQYHGGLHFSAMGRTAFHDVVKQALNAVRVMKSSYASQGIDCKRPQVFIITDGYSTDPKDNPAVVDEAKALCAKYIDTGKVAMHVILLPGGSTSDSKALSSNIKHYKVEDCTYGLPAAGTFINASIVGFSSSSPGMTVKTELPEAMKTTEAVQRNASGTRVVSQDVEIWN